MLDSLSVENRGGALCAIVYQNKERSRGHRCIDAIGRFVRDSADDSNLPFSRGRIHDGTLRRRTCRFGRRARSAIATEHTWNLGVQFQRLSLSSREQINVGIE